MTATIQGTNVIVADVNGKKVYVTLTGGHHTFWGPEPEDYSTSSEMSEAARFSSDLGMLDIDLIDTKRFLPGHDWQKEDIGYKS